MSNSAGLTVHQAQRASASPETFRRKSSLVLILTLLLLAILWITAFHFLSGEWAVNEQYTYGWFVPFLGAFLFWLRWERRPTPSRSDSVHRTRLWIVIGVLALLPLFPLRLFEIANPDWRPLGWLHLAIAASVTLLAIWSGGGRPWLRHFAFPVLFFFVAVPWISPIEEPIVQGLMRGIAAIASETLNLFGIPTQLEGNLIRVNSGLVGVSEACSGVRSLQTSLMIGLLFGELHRLTIINRWLLVLGAICLALIANTARAFFLVWLFATKGVAAMTKAHGFAGYLILLVVFAGSLALAQWLHHSPGQQDRKLNPARAHAVPLPSLAIISAALAWVVAVEIAVQSWYRWHEKNLIARPSWAVQWPTDAAGYRAIKIDDDVRSTLRFDTGQEASWKSGSTTNYLFFFRWSPGGASVLRARAHRPDICLPSAGWKQVADGGVSAVTVRPNLVLPVRHITFRRERSDLVAHTFFCLQEDRANPTEPRPDLSLPLGVQPDWSYTGRWRVVRNGIRNLGQQILEVIVVAPAGVDQATTENQFRQLVRQLVIPTGENGAR